MALIKCPDCGREVSDKAQACIHCGCPLTKTCPRPEKIFYGVRCIKDTWVMGKAKTLISKAWVTNKFATGINDISILASGITKERAELLLDYLVSHNGEGEIFLDEKSDHENEQLTRYIDVNLNPNASLMCPRCGSKEINIGERGYSLISGFLESNQTVNRCGKCGYSWKP